MLSSLVLKFFTPSLPPQEQAQRVKEFLKSCSPQTRDLYKNIIDLEKSKGALNPVRLTSKRHLKDLYHALKFVFKYGPGQSTTAFHDIGSFKKADAAGIAYEDHEGGPAEYAIVRSAAAAKVSKKIAALHNAKDALLFPAGITAIVALFASFPRDQVILVPENCYSPATRALSEKLGIKFETYPNDADAEAIKKIIDRIEARGDKISLLYMENPTSKVYGICDIDPIVKLAKERNITTSMDNTWANHTGFKPLDHGIDIGVEAGTKYAGGYGDSPSGYIYSNDEELLKKISWTSRVLGLGSVGTFSCGRLYHRINSTEERMKQQHENAMTVIDWFKKQPFIDSVNAPYLPESPDHGRFTQYFNQANGLYTLVFDDSVTMDQIEKFVGKSPLLYVGESWGGHADLATPPYLNEKTGKIEMRLSAGLSTPQDIIRSHGVGAFAADLSPLTLAA